MGNERRSTFSNDVSSSTRTNAFVAFLSDAKQLCFIEDITKSQKGKGKVTKSERPKSAVSRYVKFVESPAADGCNDASNDYDVHMTHHENYCSDDDEIMGKNLFGFKTVKRYRLSTKQTPKECDTSATATPITSSKKQRNSRKVESTTPFRLASRMDTNIASDDSADSDDSAQSFPDSPINSSRLLDRSTTQHLPNMAENFFNAHNCKPVTSNHTLARLREDGVLDQTSLRDILASRPNQYIVGMRVLLAEHRNMFKNWMLQMCLGFNLMLYGYGSKKNLMEEFRRSYCSHYHCVVINGFFPNITLKNILLSVYDDCLGLSDQLGDTDSVIKEIDEHLNKKDEVLYIFVHNIDGPMVRNSSVQYVLSNLAALENVHMIASVDHINAPLMWNQSVVTKYRWLWYDATTFEPYMEETSYENSLISQHSGALALRSMINVFKSLTPNAKSIFILMTKYHIDHSGSQSYIGIPFQMLYQKCREGFLVNSDQTLRTQLTEFRDHKLIRSRKGVDGSEHVFLPADLATLNDFLEQAESLDL